MSINPDLVAPCGLYCGVCAVYIAHRDQNQKFKERLLSLYKGEIPGKGRLPNSENLTIYTSGNKSRHKYCSSRRAARNAA